MAENELTHSQVEEFFAHAGTPLLAGLPLSSLAQATGANVYAGLALDDSGPVGAVTSYTSLVDYWKLGLRDEKAAQELLESTLRIEQLTVTPRSRRQGVATALLRDLERSVAASSIRYVVATIAAEPALLAFFRAAGYTLAPRGGQAPARLPQAGFTYFFGTYGKREVWKRLTAEPDAP